MHRDYTTNKRRRTNLQRAVNNDISPFTIVLFGMFILIVLGSVIVTILPEGIDQQCLTPEDVFYIGEEKFMGYMVSCP